MSAIMTRFEFRKPRFLGGRRGKPAAPLALTLWGRAHTINEPGIYRVAGGRLS